MHLGQRQSCVENSIGVVAVYFRILFSTQGKAKQLTSPGLWENEVIDFVSQPRLVVTQIINEQVKSLCILLQSGPKGVLPSFLRRGLSKIEKKIAAVSSIVVQKKNY